MNGANINNSSVTSLAHRRQTSLGDMRSAYQHNINQQLPLVSRKILTKWAHKINNRQADPIDTIGHYL